jgi:hypothetical protein
MSARPASAAIKRFAGRLRDAGARGSTTVIAKPIAEDD